MTERPIRIEFHSADFFRLPTKKLRLEAEPGTGRTYFIANNQIVAVGKASEATHVD